MHIQGMNVVPHPLAIQVVHKVQRHPIRKRRRNWRVVREEQPGCWVSGTTFFMHPVLVERLKEAVRT